MEGSFQLIDIIILIGICQGLFLSLTLQRIANNNRKANMILSSLILIVTILLIGRFLFFRVLTYWVFQWSILVDTTLFIFGPLLYIYVRRLMFKKDDKFFLSKIHSVPALLFLLISCYYLGVYSPEEYYTLYREGKLSLFFNSSSLFVILLNGSYLFASFLLIQRFKKDEKLVLSFNQNPIVYLNYFLIAIGLCILTWALSLINYQLFDKHFIYVDYNTVWIAISVFIYVIGYFSLKQPELFRLPLEKKLKGKKDRLSKNEALILRDKLDSLMLNEKLFLQPNLTLKDVAETLNTSTNNISWLLNTVYNITFYDFINGFRIKEFIIKVENNEHLQHTILALSMDVGFNSKSTFNKAFKLSMKLTPSNFIKNISAA